MAQQLLHTGHISGNLRRRGGLLQDENSVPLRYQTRHVQR